MERRTVYYSGNVQGVGFRYTANQIATSFQVTGYVRNLSDGRVELVAEGAVAELTSFLDRIRETMRDHIRQITSSETSASGEFTRFEIAVTR